MKLKEGDKLLCKQKLTLFPHEDRDLIPGRYYSITFITDEWFEVNVYENYRFTLKKKNKSHYIWDVFYSKNELRKMKLNEIEGRR